MQRNTIIGIIGDRNEKHPLHLAGERALADASGSPTVEWIPTDRITGSQGVELSRYAGFLVAPGSPYQSMDGALAAIRYARERRVPLLGTCGGFQHMVVELIRNVAGIADADHEETSPGAARLAITALECSLKGQSHPVRMVPGTRAAAVYNVEEAVEPFYCSYGLNREYRSMLESQGLVISGFGVDGEARIIELPRHPFFLGTLYVPQAQHQQGEPHPLIRALVAAAAQRS